MEENPHFACSSKDCNLRFSSETHLKIHKKKHEMVLSLGKTNMLTSDQTPTPTTFYRNCEEVGLFQDLQNVNPFEETFRKAAEAARAGAPTLHSGLGFSTHSADDTLHTPHVFPNIVEHDSPHKISGLSHVENSRVLLCEDAEIVIRQEADTSLKITSSPHYELNIDGELTEKHPLITPKVDKQSEQNDVQVLLRMPDGTLLQLSTKPINQKTSALVGGGTISVVEPLANNSTVILNTETSEEHSRKDTTTSSAVKQKLKQALMGSGNKHLASRASTSVLSPSKIVPIPTSKLLRKSGESTIVRRASSSTNSEEDGVEGKRRIALERNRAAAMRCRERRKAWVAELGRKADIMTATNQALLQEVTSLRAEVARLKALLLTHRDCPVTLAAIANAAGGVAENKKNKSVKTDDEVMVIIRKKEEPVKRTGGAAPSGSRLRERLSLNIEHARSSSANVTTVELDSPLVRSDEVLSSVAPTTPNEADKIVSFPDEHMDIVHENEIEERTPVIQLNPNVVLRSNSAYS